MVKMIGSVDHYVNYGWKSAKERIGQHWLPLLIIAIVLGALFFAEITFGTDVIGVNALGGEETSLNKLGIVLQVLSVLFSIWYGIGLIKLGFFALNNKRYTLSSLFVHRRSELRKYIVTMILLFLVLVLPFAVIFLVIFYVVPHLAGLFHSDLVGAVFGFLAFLLSLFVFCALFVFLVRVTSVLGFVVIDHAGDMSPPSLIRHTRNISKGCIWNLFSVGLACGFLNILGLLALGVGLLWTVPLTQIAMAKLYRDMDDAYHKKNQDALEA